MPKIESTILLVVSAKVEVLFIMILAMKSALLSVPVEVIVSIAAAVVLELHQRGSF